MFRNFGVWTDLSDVGTSWLSLKPHLECFTNPYHIYIKCFCTLISCEWVYGTTLSLILLNSRASFVVDVKDIYQLWDYRTILGLSCLASCSFLLLNGSPLWRVVVGLQRAFSLLVSCIPIGESVPNTYLRIAHIGGNTLVLPPIVGLRIP